MAASEFDRKEFEAWLNTQPREVSLAIGSRAVLRLMPLLGRCLKDKQWPAKKFGIHCFLPLLRGMVLSWVAAKYPARDRALAAASNAAYAAISVVSNSSLPTSEFTGFIVNAAVGVAQATLMRGGIAERASVGVYHARDIASLSGSNYAHAALASAIEDQNIIVQGKAASLLTIRLLWSDGMPKYLNQIWRELKNELFALNEDWQVWTDWYEARLEGREANEALEVARVTLPEALWKQGPKAVNAEIRNLIELSAEKGDQAVEARMGELRKQYPETEGDAEDASLKPQSSAAKTRSTSGQASDGFRIPLHSDLPNVWILQYRPEDRVTRWTGEATPGSTLRWKTEKGLPKEMRDEDRVIYWRTIDPNNKKDRGGIVGTGHIVSTETKVENGVLRFLTEVHEFDEADRLDRDDVIAFAGIDRKNWRGAVLGLPSEQALKVDELLRERSREGLFGETLEPEPAPGPGPTPEPFSEPDTDGQIHVRRDDAERDHDALGRAPLAVSLAWTLHEIWCNEQGLKPFRPRKPQADAAGFVAHIDAPWGGGKTSFANLVERTLNPDLDDKTPEFLSNLYSDRDDMSGLFIKHTHELDKLRDGAGEYLWEDEARRPWIIVPFNAWLNQHVDPPWWSFYQTIRKVGFAAILKDGLSKVWQRDDGSYYTIRQNRYSRFGRWAGLWLREVGWRFWTPEMRNSFIGFALTVAVAFVLQQYGLFDLKALTAMFSPPQPSLVPVDKDVLEATGEVAQGASTGLKALATILIVLLGGASALKSVFAAFTQTLLPGTADAAKNYSLGSADPLARFRRHFGKMMREIGRPVLVVIDDIDRCEPKFIVEMTRGLQTILKSPRVVYLLLGDRNWIEQAFEVCHDDMKNINVGPEHTFGGRFVEKAIQLSFVLPDIGEHKDDYVREVLIGRARAASAGPVGVPEAQPQASMQSASPSEVGAEAPPVEISKVERQELRETISKARTVQEIDEAGAAQLKARAADPAFQRAVREEVILGRAAQKETVETEIGHRLEPLAQYLPGNPRHIKRIINAISMYQNSILLTEKDYVEAEFGGELWRRLVIGVVLMVGFPKSWGMLAKHPDWAELLVNDKPLPQKGTGTQANADFDALGSNADFVALLGMTELVEKIGGDPVDTIISPDVVRWLNTVIPIAAG